ncbi:MAG: hypothetical protein AABZ64_06335 [Nitrospinota bacterium]
MKILFGIFGTLLILMFGAPLLNYGTLSPCAMLRLDATEKTREKALVEILGTPIKTVNVSSPLMQMIVKMTDETIRLALTYMRPYECFDALARFHLGNEGVLLERINPSLASFKSEFQKIRQVEDVLEKRANELMAAQRRLEELRGQRLEEMQKEAEVRKQALEILEQAQKERK